MTRRGRDKTELPLNRSLGVHSKLEQDSLYLDVPVQPLNLFDLSSIASCESRPSVRARIQSRSSTEFPPLDVLERVLEVSQDGFGSVEALDET